MAAGKRVLGALGALLLVPWLDAGAASSARAAVAPAERSLASSLGMGVQPAGEPDSREQLRDQGECYAWAKDWTGVDPLGLDQESGDPAELTGGDSGARWRSVARGERGGSRALGGVGSWNMRRDAVRRGERFVGNLGTLLYEAREQGYKNEEERAQFEARGPSEARALFEREFSACLVDRNYRVTLSPVASSPER